MQPDWGKTYAPVGNFTMFRYLASLAAGYGVAIDRSDFVTAPSTPMSTIQSNTWKFLWDGTAAMAMVATASEREQSCD